MTRCLQTTGQGFFEEVIYDVPPLNEDEICVRAVMTGVCRSDIDMMQGNFVSFTTSYARTRRTR